MQDDGISNVKVARWDPAATPADILPASLHHALPFLMGAEPKRILVLFAGVGRDMVELDGLAQGRADITGVELNPAVVDLVRDPLLAGMNLRAFHARPNMHLVAREGRDFLDNDRGRYDLVFVATNGSTNDARTGHTRKYLDTYEAMASFLDHLAPGPGSMIVFVNQPVIHKAESLRLLFAERGLGDFGNAVFAFGAPETRGQDSMVIKPAGLTRDEIAAIERKVASWPHPRRVLYSPSGAGEPRFVDAVLGLTRGPLVTDDRPFVHEVSWRDFELLPAKARFTTSSTLRAGSRSSPSCSSARSRSRSWPSLAWDWACGAAASGACLGRGCCTSSWPACRTCAWRSASSARPSCSSAARSTRWP